MSSGSPPGVATVASRSTSVSATRIADRPAGRRPAAAHLGGDERVVGRIRAAGDLGRARLRRRSSSAALASAASRLPLTCAVAADVSTLFAAADLCGSDGAGGLVATLLDDLGRCRDGRLCGVLHRGGRHRQWSPDLDCADRAPRPGSPLGPGRGRSRESAPRWRALRAPSVSWWWYLRSSTRTDGTGRTAPGQVLSDPALAGALEQGAGKRSEPRAGTAGAEPGAQQRRKECGGGEQRRSRQRHARGGARRWPSSRSRSGCPGPGRRRGRRRSERGRRCGGVVPPSPAPSGRDWELGGRPAAPGGVAAQGGGSAARARRRVVGAPRSVSARAVGSSGCPASSLRADRVRAGAAAAARGRGEPVPSAVRTLASRKRCGRWCGRSRAGRRWFGGGALDGRRRLPGPASPPAAHDRADGRNGRHSGRGGATGAAARKPPELPPPRPRRSPTQLRRRRRRPSRPRQERQGRGAPIPSTARAGVVQSSATATAARTRPTRLGDANLPDMVTPEMTPGVSPRGADLKPRKAA